MFADWDLLERSCQSGVGRLVCRRLQCRLQTQELLRRITASGVGATIRRIEIKRTEKQIIEILIAPPRPAAAFTAAELQTFFR